MKKSKILFLPLVAAVTMLTACSDSAEINQGPELQGINDITCLVNTSVDLLDGVSALDLEDGDITPDLHISITPEVAVNDGYATFTETGEYEVCYEIYDSKGKLARTTVNATVTDREVYMNSVLTSGFSLNVSGGTKILKDGLNGNVYTFKVSGNEIAEDVRLSRVFTLVSGKEYTFKYSYSVNVAGIAAFAADGVAVSEYTVVEGENVTEFTYSVPYSQNADGTAATENVNLELWFGDLEGDIEVSFSGAEAGYFEEDSGYTDLISQFTFTDNIINRDDKAHAVYASADGKSATLEVTETGEIWQYGMFIKTGIRMSAGEEYQLDFEIESEQGNPFQICIQHDQWQDSDAIILQSPQGHVTSNISATADFSGELWLFIRSGTHSNKITISDFSIKTKLGGYRYEAYRINGFSTNNYDGGEGSVDVEYGKALYTVKSFGNSWGNNEIGTPSFALSGSAGNFVVTFRAKASERLSVVFAGTLAESWDTFVWKELKFTTEEQLFTVRCDDKGVEGLYKFVWQFGNPNNAIYNDVLIEISDIRICYLSEAEG